MAGFTWGARAFEIAKRLLGAYDVLASRAESQDRERCEALGIPFEGSAVADRIRAAKNFAAYAILPVPEHFTLPSNMIPALAERIKALAQTVKP